jgi:hypothetical protein
LNEYIYGRCLWYQNMATDHITSILSEDYAHFEEHCMSHPSEAEPVFDCVIELRTALTAFRLATEASRNESAVLKAVADESAVLKAVADESDAIHEPAIEAVDGPLVSAAADETPSTGPEEATLVAVNTA